MKFPPHTLDHVQQRALERYGLELDREDFANLNHRILAGKSVCLDRKTGTDCELHALEFKGCAMRVIFNRERGMVVTILPPQPPATRAKKARLPRRYIRRRRCGRA